jgi:hypothetical protein
VTRISEARMRPQKLETRHRQQPSQKQGVERQSWRKLRSTTVTRSTCKIFYRHRCQAMASRINFYDDWSASVIWCPRLFFFSSQWSQGSMLKAHYPWSCSRIRWRKQTFWISDLHKYVCIYNIGAFCYKTSNAFVFFMLQMIFPLY